MHYSLSKPAVGFTRWGEGGMIPRGKEKAHHHSTPFDGPVRRGGDILVIHLSGEREGGERGL